MLTTKFGKSSIGDRDKTEAKSKEIECFGNRVRIDYELATIYIGGVESDRVADEADSDNMIFESLSDWVDMLHEDNHACIESKEGNCIY